MIRSRVTSLVTAALVVLVVLVDRRSIVGAVIVLSFLSLVPGSALARLLRFPAEGVGGWVIVVGASFSIDAIVTEAMVYARVWTPARGLFALGLVVVGFVVAEYLVSARRIAAATVDRQDS